ncbi:THO complex subunit 7B-like [Carex rostrata]
MIKARRVAGRGEEMSAHYAFSPSEDEVIIKQRLLTRTTTTRGEPPLKKLQKRFTAFATEIEKQSDNNSAECEKFYKAFLQEIATFELPLLKSQAVVDANIREKESFIELQEEIESQICQAKSDIEELKKQLEMSRVERRHKEECEAVRKLVASWPPRSETERLITDLQAEIADLEAEDVSCVRMLDLRRKQFSLLLHVVEELQNTITEDDQKLSLEELSGGAGSDAMALD